MKKPFLKKLIVTLLIWFAAMFLCRYLYDSAFLLLRRLIKHGNAYTSMACNSIFLTLVYALLYTLGSLAFFRGQKKQLILGVLLFALIGIFAYFSYRTGTLYKFMVAGPLRALSRILRIPLEPGNTIDFLYAAFALPVILFCIPSGSEKQQKTTLYRKEKFYADDSPLRKMLICVLLIFWIIGVMNFYSLITGAAFSIPGFTLFGFACLVIAIMWTVSLVNESRIKNYKKIVLPACWPEDCAYAGYSQGLGVKGSQRVSSKALSFYERCRANDVLNMDSEGSRQKALLIAKNMGLSAKTPEQVFSMYEEGKAAAEANSAASSQQTDRIRKVAKRIEELNDLAEKMRYFGLHGREKRVAMLKPLRKEALRNAKEAEATRSLMEHTLIQKEHDWAVHGGIASGIAGPAAGVATALEIQQKNAAIRAQNEANMPLVAMISSHFSNTADEYRAQANYYARLIAETKNKLMLDQDPQQVFANLVIENPTVTVSETGAVTVEADFAKKDAYRIYETIDPTIDGTVAARLYQNGSLVASAYFVLPVEGVTNTVRLSAISTKPTTENATYELSFEPVDLWAIEKL